MSNKKVSQFRRAQSLAGKQAQQLYKKELTQSKLDKQYEKGFSAGKNKRANDVMIAYYTATMLVLHDEFGFDVDKSIEALNLIEGKLYEFISNIELIEEAHKRLNIKIQTDDAFYKVDKLEDVEE